MKAPFDRRGFLGMSAATGLFAWSHHPCRGEDQDPPPSSSQPILNAEGRPNVTYPRATSGDHRVEPAWEERLTVSVGAKEADIIGVSSRAIQGAIDYVAQLGGGTVRLLPGTYLLRSSLQLRSGVRLLGSGEETILTKPPSIATKLLIDSDWYDQEITLQDPKGFEVGDSVCLKTRNTDQGGTEVLKRVLVARSGNRFKIDRPLRRNFWTMGDASCSSLFPIVTSEETNNLVIENLVIDGNGKNNDNLNGNYGGCLFLQDVNQVVIRRVTTRNYNGDGISWQICHDVVVEDCYSHDNQDLGLHPGSGSQRPIIRRNRIERCQIGIFFCWGVKFGLAEENRISDIRGQGISIGHRDTDNLVRRNQVRNSGQTGILFRPERGPSFCGHRNRIEENIIENSGPAKGVAIDIQGGTEEITLEKNSIRELRSPEERIGIRIGKETKSIRLVDNAYNGLAKDVVQMES